MVLFLNLTGAAENLTTTWQFLLAPTVAW